MKCTECGEWMLCESLGSGLKRFTCQCCGESMVLDKKGRRLLTEGD